MTTHRLSTFRQSAISTQAGGPLVTARVRHTPYNTNWIGVQVTRTHTYIDYNDEDFQTVDEDDWKTRRRQKPLAEVLSRPDCERSWTEQP